MRRLTPTLPALLILPLLAAAAGTPPARAAAPAAAEPAAMHGVPSRELLAIAEQALASAATAVREAPGWMGGAHSRQAALAAALADMQGALARVRSGWATRSVELPRAVRRGSEALAALRVAWVRARVAAPQAGRRLHVLAAAYDALRARHGPEAARLARGGGLTPAEAAQLRRLQRARGELPLALRPLRDRAAALGDRTLAADLDRWAEQSQRLAVAEPSLEALLAAIWLADQLAGEWRAAAPALAANGGDVAAVDAAVQEVLGESEVGYVFVADLGREGEDESGEREGEHEAAPAAGSDGSIAERVQVAEGVEIAVLGKAGEGRARDGQAEAGEVDAAETQTGWEGEWNDEGAAAEWEGFDRPGGEDSWSPAEDGWEGAEPGDEGEADEPAPAAEGDGNDTGTAAEAAAPGDITDATSFEVVTDSGEVLVVDIGPDGTLTTRPKQTAPPAPSAPPPTQPAAATAPAPSPKPPTTPEPPSAPPPPPNSSLRSE